MGLFQFIFDNEDGSDALHHTDNRHEKQNKISRSRSKLRFVIDIKTHVESNVGERKWVKD